MHEPALSASDAPAPDHAPGALANGVPVRPFVVAAILIALSAGGGWGLWLLIAISGRGSFTDISISGIGFSHAYYGAIRHAIAMGFVSMLLIGFSSRLMLARDRNLPASQRAPKESARGVFRVTFRGIFRGPLRGPFILLNAGIAVRVVAQTASDFATPVFYVLGLSGVLELVAIAWWGGHLVRSMRGGEELSPAAREQLTPQPAGTATSPHPVAASLS